MSDVHLFHYRNLQAHIYHCALWVQTEGSTGPLFHKTRPRTHLNVLAWFPVRQGGTTIPALIPTSSCSSGSRSLQHSPTHGHRHRSPSFLIRSSLAADRSVLRRKPVQEGYFTSSMQLLDFMYFFANLHFHSIFQAVVGRPFRTLVDCMTNLLPKKRWKRDTGSCAEP